LESTQGRAEKQFTISKKGGYTKQGGRELILQELRKVLTRLDIGEEATVIIFRGQDLPSKEES
jgi:hypothetical protein